MRARHYLDHASTTPLRPSAATALSEWVERLGTSGGAGDPGRVHEEGRAAREAIEKAREEVANLAGVAPRRIVFTSSATEATNTAVTAARAAAAAVAGAAVAGEQATVVCAAVEHSSVREAARSTGPVTELAVEPSGAVSLDHLESLLATLGERPALVSCQWANHEVGTVQPIVEVAELCGRAGVPLHVDAAAAFGHVPVDCEALGTSYVSLSAHKMGGPAGVGALVLGRGTRLRPFLVGGSEERGRRAGGENLLGIVGFGAAAAELAEEGRMEAERAAASGAIEDLARLAQEAGGVELLGPSSREGRLPHLVCISVDGVFGEAVLLALDRAGVAAHSGSACSSELLEPSPVLSAMGADPDRSLRLSVGWSTEQEDIEAFGEAFGPAVESLRKLGGQD